MDIFSNLHWQPRKTIATKMLILTWTTTWWIFRLRLSSTSNRFRHGLVVRRNIKKDEQLSKEELDRESLSICSHRQEILWPEQRAECCWHRRGKVPMERKYRECFRHGLVVRIAGSHPAGPGSIPGAAKNFLFLWSLAGLVLLLIWTILQTTFRLLPLTTHGMDIFDINTHCPPEKTWVKPVKLCSITWNPAWSSFRHGLVVRKKLLINPCSGLVTLIRNILCFLKLHQVKYSKKIRIETDFFTRTNGMV